MEGLEMKKLLCILLSVAMLLSLAACNISGKPTESSMAEAPVTEPPITESPATESPITESPTTEPPVTESPATEPSATESPATESPVTGSTATEPPEVEAPATEPSTIDPPATEGACTHTNAFDIPPDSDWGYKEPTCTKDGYCLKYCPDCNKRWTEPAKALGHKIMETPYDNGYKAATCCSEGQWGAKEYCYVCNTVITEGSSIPVDPHNHIGKTYTINKKPATWTDCGYSGDICCDGCKNNIAPENKGVTLSAEKDCPWASQSYSASNDKIKCECQHHNYIEYREPDPIRIPSIEVVRSMSVPGEGVKMVGFTVAGGSLDYSADFEIITDKQFILNWFYIEKAEANSIWDFHILLTEGYYIPDGTQFRITITDSSGRSFAKTYTVRRYAWNDYDVI